MSAAAPAAHTADLFFTELFFARQKNSFKVLLRRKVLSALVSSSFKNLSSRVGSHTLSESVYFAPLSLFGLVSPLHKNLLFFSAGALFSRESARPALFLCPEGAFFIFINEHTGAKDTSAPYLRCFQLYNQNLT